MTIHICNYSRYTYLVHWASVILSEAKNLSSTEQSYNEILRFAQNDKVNSYSYLSASAGGSLEALLAGYNPKKTPVARATVDAIIPALHEIMVGQNTSLNIP